MKLFLKFVAAATVAVALGLGSAYAVLRVEALHGKANLASDNPYERAAYAARDFLPGEVARP